MRAVPRLGRRKASNNASNATSTEHHEHDTTVSDVKPTFAGVMLPKESSDGSTRGENQQDLIGYSENSSEGSDERQLLRPLERVAQVTQHVRKPHGQGLPTLFGLYGICTQMVPTRCPCACISFGFFLVCVICGLGVGLAPPVIETDFSAFMKTDVESSIQHDALVAALEFRQEGAERRLGLDLYLHYTIYTTYVLNTGFSGSLFSAAVLSEIAGFEQRLRDISAWTQFCDSLMDSYKAFCNPGMSVANYGLPRLETTDGHIVPSTLSLDGEGADRMPLETMFGTIMNHGMEKILLPSEFDGQSAFELAENHAKITAVRSAFRFKLFCCSATDSQAIQGKVISDGKEKWIEFLEDHVLDVLRNPQPDGIDAEDWALRVWYEGSELEGIEVLQALRSDIMLAAGSMTFVFLYMLFHTRSIFLSSFALLLIGLSVPLSYVVFLVLAQSQTMSIASFLSLFLIVGLGADVVFVYTDFWMKAEKMNVSEAERFAYTYKEAGKATFATTITTAVSFFANLASVLRSLREFGVFMGICVMLVWLLVTLLYVPLCSLDRQYCKRCRLRCCPFQPVALLQCYISPWDRWTWCLLPWRHGVSCCATFLAIIFLVCALFFAEIEGTVPSLFPDDHNRVRGQEVFSLFASPETVFPDNTLPAPVTADVCHPSEFNNLLCPISWCEVTATSVMPASTDGTCYCYRKEAHSCADVSADSVVANIRLVSSDTVSDSHFEGTVADHMVNGWTGGVSFDSTPRSSSFSTKSVGPCMLEEWETAQYTAAPMAHAEYTLKRANTSLACTWEELCFCGTSACRPEDGWIRTEDFVLGDRRLEQEELPGVRLVDVLAQGRRLQPTYIPGIRAEDRISVDVVFGIDIAQGAPLLGERLAKERWSFSQNFDAKEPWAQRNMMTLCTQFFSNLLVVEQHCWLQEFEEWLTSRGYRFPVQSNMFHNLVSSFKADSLIGVYSASEFMWTRNDELKACYMNFRVDFSRNAATSDGLAYKMHWDDYINHFNGEAESVTKGAFHASSDWVRLDAQQELISSTIVTLVVVLCLAFVGMVVFTFNIVLSLFVVIGTMQVVCGLAFYIVCVMSWTIGAVEVIALIVFIGYAVTYSLHVAHKYGDEDASEDVTSVSTQQDVRRHRTAYALRSIGGAALGSAATTVGSSTFLLFCQLTIFLKLGGVVLAVTLWSIVTALATLPATLLLVGPTKPGCIGGLPWRYSDLRHTAPDSRPSPQALDDTSIDRLAAELEQVLVSASRQRAHSVVSLSDVRAELDDCDIGTEGSLEPIWVHDVDHAMVGRAREFRITG